MGWVRNARNGKAAGVEFQECPCRLGEVSRREQMAKSFERWCRGARHGLRSFFNLGQGEMRCQHKRKGKTRNQTEAKGPRMARDGRRIMDARYHPTGRQRGYPEAIRSRIEWASRVLPRNPTLAPAARRVAPFQKQ